MNPMLRRPSASSSTLTAASGPQRWAWIAALVVGACGVLVAPKAHAAEPSAQVRAALDVLAGSATSSGQGGMAGSAAAQDALGLARTSVEVARGQTLDALVRAHFGKSPLKPEVVREAMIKLNPQALGPDGRKRLTAGTRLQLPTRDDLVRHAFGGAQAQNLAAADQAALADSHAASHSAAAGARRGWVRYP